jgi:hypothetical protein
MGDAARCACTASRSIGGDELFPSVRNISQPPVGIDGAASEYGSRLHRMLECQGGTRIAFTTVGGAHPMTIRRLLQVIPLLLVASALAAVGVVTQSATLSPAELKKIGASASTAAEHARLTAHYRAHAAEHEADAAIHDGIAAEARKRAASSDDAWDLARDAVHYADHSREAAEALRELAALHEAMGKRAGAK